MTRIQLACCALLTSAFVLAGLLISQLSVSAARADQVINEGGLTFLTANTQSNEESLFVIDNITARLIVVRADVNKNRLEVLARQDLAGLFDDR